MSVLLVLCIFFFFNDTATTEIYPLSLHDALPISCCSDSTKHTAMGVGRLDPVVLRSLVLVVRVVWVVLAAEDKKLPADGRRDRKSTRLNSSHSQISYAVFCLKKKKRVDTHADIPS